jgi:hypothetical protein
MDVFSLRDSVVGEYRDFATSFTTIYAEDIREQVARIYSTGRYWPDPLIQVNPHYKSGASLAALVKAGVLHPRVPEIFRNERGPLELRKHQEQAIALASSDRSFVVTTGTGSGKSLCFFIPIVSTVLSERAKGEPRRTRAIVVYPMNALANSQREELEKFVGNVADRPVTFARYTGQDDDAERARIAEHPPDILLTNFMMLELLMTRQDEVDRRVIANCEELRFLVLDELHTYRGRQGADVALLVRRVRERLAPTRLLCIGTSATMSSEGTQSERNRVVAAVAAKLFAADIQESGVVVESLQRVTDESRTAESVKAQLGDAIARGMPANINDAGLRMHPLAIWIETRLGLQFSSEDQRWVRAKPRSVREAAADLASDSGRAREACAVAIREALLVSSQPERERTKNANAAAESFFAFKLHQFLSGAGHCFATMEPSGQRTVTVEGQKFLPDAPEKRLYAVHFCRECGHEYHPVFVDLEKEPRFLHRDIDDVPVLDRDDSHEDELESVQRPGFVTLHPTDPEFTFADRVEDYPRRGSNSIAPAHRASNPTIDAPACERSSSSPTVLRASASRRAGATERAPGSSRPLPLSACDAPPRRVPRLAIERGLRPSRRKGEAPPRRCS